jgi:hypothetical protein
MASGDAPTGSAAVELIGVHDDRLFGRPALPPPGPTALSSVRRR